MRKPRVFFALAHVVLGVALGQTVKDPARPSPVEVSSRAKVVASLAQSTVRIGDPLILHYHLKNVSSGVISRLVYMGFKDDCWLMVTSAAGVEFPRTKEGDRLRQMSMPPVLIADFTTGSLGPGVEDYDQVIDVSKLYQLDRPGSYFVRIARRIGVPPDMPYPSTAEEAAKTPLEEAVSELIPFTITP